MQLRDLPGLAQVSLGALGLLLLATSTGWLGVAGLSLVTSASGKNSQDESVAPPPSAEAFNPSEVTKLPERSSRQVGQLQESPQRNLLLLLDTSSSMAATPEPILEFVSSQASSLGPRDLLAVVAYAEENRVLLPLSRPTPENLAQLEKDLRRLRPHSLTNLSQGLLAAGELLADDAPSRILLVSDGRLNRGLLHQNELVSLVSEIKDRGILLDTSPLGPDPDHLLLQALADAGGGAYLSSAVNQASTGRPQ